ncbi:MAG: hypothetical protein AB7R90_06410 [Reyranellaceae bacterium]
MKMRRRQFVERAAAALLLGGVPAIAQAQARQVSFQRWQANADIVFDYRLTDYSGKELRLGFRLPARVVDESRRLVSAFSNEDLADYVEAALRNYVARSSPDVSVEIVRQPRRLEFVVRGPSQAEADRISASLQREYGRAEREYLDQGFLALEGRKVFIDYGRIVAHYAPLLRGAAQAIAAATAGGGANGRLALALALIQTIPYDPLDSRDVESGFDFVTPPTLFDTNMGDCDSKAVALAAILRGLIDRSRMVIVLLPNHAVLGIDLPAKGGERVLNHGGRQYLLMEPAGPAPFLPGRLFPKSAADLDAGRVERVVAV